jgi:hypothetical protein
MKRSSKECWASQTFSLDAWHQNNNACRNQSEQQIHNRIDTSFFEYRQKRSEKGITFHFRDDPYFAVSYPEPVNHNADKKQAK